MLVFGGVALHDDRSLWDGAVYDPSRSRWERLPPSPIAPGQGDYAAAWTGQELLVWNGYRAALFTPR